VEEDVHERTTSKTKTKVGVDHMNLTKMHALIDDYANNANYLECRAMQRKEAEVGVSIAAAADDGCLDGYGAWWKNACCSPTTVVSKRTSLEAAEER
jgi:hypothetical protein